MYGFSGNTNQGIVLSASQNVSINNIYIDNLYSETGNVFGISIWSNVIIEDIHDITIKNINAGTLLDITSTGVTESDLPNLAPEGCSIKLQHSKNSLIIVFFFTKIYYFFFF